MATMDILKIHMVITQCKNDCAMPVMAIKIDTKTDILFKMLNYFDVTATLMVGVRICSSFANT